MKKYLIAFTAFFAMSYYGHAQVGIGTTNPKQASALDIEAKDKGVLLPRVRLEGTDRLLPIKGNVGDMSIKGLIVYNTNADLDPKTKGNSEGFYVWNGTVWEKISTQAEVIKLIKENTTEANSSITEVIKLIVNTGSEGALKGSSIVMYDFEKKEFYTLIKNGDNVITTPIDLGLGNVFYGKLTNDTNAKDVLYSEVTDASGKKTKVILDLTNTIKEIITDTNSEIIKELKEAVSYDITSAVTETNIKFGGKVVSVFSSSAVVKTLEADVIGVDLPEALYNKGINVFDIKLYDTNGKLITVGITDIKLNKTDIDFALGNGEVYTPIAAGNYKVVVQFTK